MSVTNHNHFSFIGRLAKDPELAYTQNQKPYCKFSIAVGKSYKNAAGDKIEHVDFFNIIAWGKLGELIAQWQKKGQRIFLEGRLGINKFTDKAGTNRYDVSFTAENIEFIDSRKDGASPSQSNPGQSNQTQADNGPDGAYDDLGDDEVPF